MGLFKMFEAAVNRVPKQIGLTINNQDYTYLRLYEDSLKLAYILNQNPGNQIGIFTGRSYTAYTGILGTLASGKTYVPFNTKFSAYRNNLILSLADINVIIVDPEGLGFISKEMELPDHIKLICPELNIDEVPTTISQNYKIWTQSDLQISLKQPKSNTPEAIAYILFTSGSTGIPKGVPVSHGNVLSYTDYLYNRYELGTDDRFAQISDFTFDLSVHDMFLCWRSAGRLYPIPENVLMAPAKFIIKNEITTLFSIPSLAQFMKRFKMLKPNVFPSLRYCVFGGESLSKKLAESWRLAAPNAHTENQYGATEITIGLSHYVLPNTGEEILSYNGIVSIGTIFSTQEYCLLNDKGKKVENEGEICFTGSQVTQSYWNNPEKSKESYFKFPNDNRIWYKTGDIVRYNEGLLYYINRKDFQVKVRGFRIELEEINWAIQEITGADRVYTVPYPVENGLADNLYSFIETEKEFDKTEILQHLRNKLTSYMVPKGLVFLTDFPLNSNGKTDKKELIKLLK